MTPRKAAVLAMQLPAGARVWIAAGFDMAWTPGEHMAAAIFDATRQANWQRGNGKGERPTPIPRPGDETRAEADRARQVERARRFQARQREGT